MYKLDILNLEWPNSDRDLNIVTPTLLYLNRQYGVTFKTESIFNGYFYILKYRPKMLLISNYLGASINFEITKLAYLMNIKVVSFISEGNIKVETAEQTLWGHNKEKTMYLDKMLLWTTRSREIFLKNYPNLKDKLVVTGATGFDRYKLLEFYKKEEFLLANKLKYKKIIGIAGWGFSSYFGDYYYQHQEHFEQAFGVQQIKMHRKDLFKIQNIYRKLIENNKDILFILRYHPGTLDFKKNEFYGLENYDNVFISNKYKHQHYQIADLINISDLWISYESTTALEAWLLNKQTFLINPTTKNFIRSIIYEGMPIVKNELEAQKLIDEYFDNGTIKGFEFLKKNRKEIIKNIIEYDDGKNYIRASKEILKILNSNNKEQKYRFQIYQKAFKQFIKLAISKSILKNRWSELNYDSNFAKKYQDKYEIIK
jgi:surface carbohydrate biosynthesis protein